MKDQRGVKELQELISDTGAAILTATEECNSTWQEAELGRTICKALNFQSKDLLYFSLIEVQAIVGNNHEPECLRLRMLVNGYLQELFNFFK
jgi:hypothetical protein